MRDGHPALGERLGQAIISRFRAPGQEIHVEAAKSFSVLFLSL